MSRARTSTTSQICLSFTVHGPVPRRPLRIYSENALGASRKPGAGGIRISMTRSAPVLTCRRKGLKPRILDVIGISTCRG